MEYSNRKKLKVFTGITSTGNLTIGHYFGVIKKLLEIQKKEKDCEIIIMIADLHALTSISKINYRKKAKEIAAILYSCGLDEKRTKVFIQSEVSEHLELSYFLSAYCSVNKLSNMIQYKDKLKKNTSSPFLLLYYPILMAADILLYDVDLVIVGRDQKQHLEFAKFLASKFNKENSDILKIPDFFIAKDGSKIMGLRDPSKKMSKSTSDNILILEKNKRIVEKIFNAKTDSENKILFNVEKKPGISNLLTIYSCISNSSIEESEKFFLNKNYSDLKQSLIEKIISEFNIIKNNRSRFLTKKIEDLLSINREIMKKEASKRIEIIKKKLML